MCRSFLSLHFFDFEILNYEFACDKIITIYFL
jgi:hypothetical protein